MVWLVIFALQEALGIKTGADLSGEVATNIHRIIMDKKADKGFVSEIAKEYPWGTNGRFWHLLVSTNSSSTRGVLLALNRLSCGKWDKGYGSRDIDNHSLDFT